MKILILNPCVETSRERFIKEGRCEQRLSSFQYVMIPISLPSIAGILRQSGFEVLIEDCVVSKKTSSDVLSLVREFGPSLIIMNIATVTYYDDIKVVTFIKSNCVGIHIAGIGNHVTSLPRTVLKETMLDSVILGEPEFTALELARSIDQNKQLKDVGSIAFRLNNELVINEKQFFHDDLDSLPFPSRDLMDNDKYTLPVINEPYTLLISSRGCPYECIFCTANQYYGRKLRLRSPRNIIDEIKEIRHKYGVRNITMWSDTSTLNREFVFQVCKKLIEVDLDVKWMCNSRVDKVDPEMLDIMARSGCIGISYGIESGNQKILDNIKKKTSLSQIRNAIRWTKEAKIDSLAHIIFGLPGETKETIEETIDFIISIDPDYAQFYCAIPFPGTEFYRLCVENGWLITQDWRRFEINQAIITTPFLSAEELNRARKRAYIRFYLRPSYIFKRIKSTGSFSGLMLLFKQGADFIHNWVLKPDVFKAEPEKIAKRGRAEEAEKNGIL